LPWLVALCRRMRQVERQNALAAAAVSALAAAAASTGLLPFGLADEVNQYTALAMFANARRLSLAPVGEPAIEAAQGPAPPAWHALAPRDVARMLATDSETGLNDAEAARRLRRYGPNALEVAPPLGFAALYGRQLGTGMTVLLSVAATASLLIGEPLNAVMIAGVVFLNAGLGAYQELRAEHATGALHTYTTPTALCRRGDELQHIAATELVPGDIVMLRAGDTVPADGRVIESYGLEVEEAVLTGESQSVYKSAAPVTAAAALPDRQSLVYMGSPVIGGRARIIVVATGMRTAVGQIANLLQHEAGTPTFLQARLVRLGRASAAVAVTCGVAFLGAGLIRRASWSTLVLGSISLITAAIPEGLPAIVTIALSAAVRRMSSRALIVRRLSAVETLGRVDVLCCDKTGTLTQNRMEVGALTSGDLRWVDGVPAAPSLTDDLRWLLVIGTVCNDAMLADGGGGAASGSTEGALVAAAAAAGLDPRSLRQAYERAAELPFSTEHGFMAVAVRHADQGLSLMLKGAPETILEFCTHQLDGGAAIPMDADARAAALRTFDRMAHGAMRVLAIAYRPLREVPSPRALAHPRGCVFAGCVGLRDPLRPEVREAVERCEGSGVRVVMATGDHRSTAIAIARQLGLEFTANAVLDGAELDHVTDAELAARLSRIRVFARVTPQHKVRIVSAMQAAGHVVAMTGDGVNDAPAVKRADVGIAMGLRGAEVTRQASSIVVADDSFTSIVHAIEEGRGVQRNLRRSLGFLLGGNLGESLFMVAATIMTGEIPLLPLHILLVNLFTDALPVVALAGLPSPAPRYPSPAPPDVFDRNFYQDVLRRGVVTGIAATAIQALGPRRTLAERRTTALAGLVAGQLVQAHNWGTGERGDRFFYGSLGISWSALFAVMGLTPLQRLFGTTSLAPAAWAQLIGISAAADQLLRRRDRSAADARYLLSDSTKAPPQRPGEGV